MTGTSTPREPVQVTVPAHLATGLTGAVLSGAVVAAALSGWVTAALARRSTRLEERARVRTTLAEAYQAYADYKEFPYAIRRRSGDAPGSERVRLSEEMRSVQSRLSYYQAWTLAEDPETGAAYNELIGQLRRVAGGSMRQAWQEPALENDPGMNIGLDRVDLRSLTAAEELFLLAARTHVSALTKPWWRRGRRRTQHAPGRTKRPDGQENLAPPASDSPPGSDVEG